MNPGLREAQLEAGVFASPFEFSGAATLRRSSSGAFTLLELLIVVSIIAILAGLTLAALAKARLTARSAHCMSNLRQVGIAVSLYVGEDGAYPLATSGDGLGHWQRVLRPYAHSNVFFCSERVSVADEYVALFSLPASRIPLHYGYNHRGAARRNPPKLNLGLGGDYALEGNVGHFVPTPESRVRAPSRMIAVGDSDANIFVAAMFPTPPPYADLLHIIFPHTVDPFGKPGVGRWHNVGANMLFCDGHVEFRKLDSWTATDLEVRQIWNNDNLPHPETW